MFEKQQQMPTNSVEEINTESLKRKTTLGSALVMGGLIATAPISFANNEGPISPRANTETAVDGIGNQVNPRPEDYSLRRIGKVNLFYLDKLKSCDPQMAKNVVAAGIIHNMTSDKSAYLATLSKINEYYQSHPEYYDLNMNIQRKNPEYNSLYEQYEIESDKLTQIYNSILQDDATGISNRLEMLNVSEEEQKYIENAPKLLSEVESIRQDIIAHIHSDAYLKILQTEFNCSPEQARNHQKTRLDNAQMINYVFSSTKYLKSEGMPAYGFFCTNTNIITLPRNVSFDSVEEYDVEGTDIHYSFFQEVVRHEFWHAVTNATDGLSVGAKELLTITRKQLQPSDSAYNIEYYGSASERYVQLKMLETELQEFGIWSKGAVFSRECSDKMLEAYINEEFAYYNSYEFIHTILRANNSSGFSNLLDYEHLYEIFAPIFNSIADSQTPETYYPPEWWGVTEQKA